jgi:Cu-processing system permease protein
MSKIFIVTRLTFHEALRRRMVLAALGLGALFLLMYNLGVLFLLSDTQNVVPDVSGVSDTLKEQIFNFLLSVGLYVVHFLGIMLAIFASVDSISGEIRSHTVQSIVTKPISRWEVVLGKWIGYALMIGGYLLLLGGGIILSIYLITGYVPAEAVPAMLLLALQALVLLSLSLLFGTRLSTLTNGVALFMLYGLAFLGAWIEQFGALFHSRAAVNIGIVASLVMPVEALWSLAAHLLEPPILQGLPSGMRFSPLLGTVSVPSTAMVVYAIAYAVVMLALAMRSFSKRDL